MSAVVLSLAEESCWDGDQPRLVRKSVTFRITSPGKVRGLRIDHEFVADFGLWYDPEDRYLVGKLTELGLGIDWGSYVFWKMLDHSEISVIDPELDLEVASIRVRGRVGGDPVGREDRSNVICLGSRRAEVAARTQDDCQVVAEQSQESSVTFGTDLEGD